MSELEDRLNAILSDPAEMEKIGRLAAQLMGEGDREAPAEPQSPSGGTPPGDLTGLMGKLGGNGDKAALVKALAPYLKPERAARLRKALRLAGLLRIAGSALGESGGGGDL